MKKMRKGMAGLLALVLAIGLITPCAMAVEPKITVKATSSYMATEDLYKITFAFSNTIDMTGGYNWLKYDPTVWTPYVEDDDSGEYVPATADPIEVLSYTTMLRDFIPESGLMAVGWVSTTIIAPTQNKNFMRIYMKLNAGKSTNDLNMNSLRMPTAADFEGLTTTMEHSYAADLGVAGEHNTIENGLLAVTFTYPGSDNDGITPIETANVTITAPAAGNAPSTNITAGTGYTATMSWATGTPATFDYGTDYTANVTLTAQSGYKFVEGTTVFKVNNSTAITLTSVTKTTATFSAVLSSPPNDPDLVTLSNAKSVVESATYTRKWDEIGSAEAAKAAVQTVVNGLSLGTGVTAVVNSGTYTAPTDGSAADRDGTNGTYETTVALSKNGKPETAKVTLTISAKEYRDPIVPPAPTPAPVTEECLPTVVTPPATASQSLPKHTYEYKTADAAATKVGSVELALVSGDSFTLTNPLDGYAQYVMTAIPAAGYCFKEWVSTVATQGSLMSASIADETLMSASINIQASSITGTAAELATYAPAFDVAAIVLSGLEATTAGQTLRLIRSDGIEDGPNYFDNACTSYKLYLTSNQSTFTLNMAAHELKEFKAPVLTVDGKSVVAATQIDKYTYYEYIYTTTIQVPNRGTEQTVTIALKNKDNKTTTYTITVMRMIENPQIIAEIEQAGDLYKVHLKLHQAIFNTFTVALKTEGKFFDLGFTDDDGNPLTDATFDTKMVGFVEKGFRYANGEFESKDATGSELSGAKAQTVKLTYDSANDNYVDAMQADVEVATLYLKSSKKNGVTVEDLNDLSVVLDVAKISDQRIPELTTGELVRIERPNTVVVIGLVDCLLPKNIQAKYGTWQVKSGSEIITEPQNFSSNRTFAVELFNNKEYQFEFVVPNHLTRTITVSGLEEGIPTYNGISLGVYGMIPGNIADLAGNCNTSVDASDRGELIKLLYSTVEPGARGDLNGDGVINAIDLGYLLSHMGRTYPESDKIAVH